MRKLAPLLCAAALTLSLALPVGAYYASNEDGASLRIGVTSADERGELLDAHVPSANHAHDLKVLKLGYFIYCRVVARG